MLAATLLAASVGSACGQREDLGDSWTGTMQEHEGAIWVTNPSEPLWPDDGKPRFEFELEQVFGAGPHGKLYTASQDPFPQVRRYRLVLRPPG